MVSTVTDNTYEFYISDADMEGGKPNFTTYNDKPLANGCLAINIDTKQGFFWDEEAQEWK